MAADSLGRLARETIACRACPRLVRWREEVARVKRRAFQDQTYWGRPVPGFGDLRARLHVLGLAPAAHGANRTGRVFTGDASGTWLFRALHRAGFANQPESIGQDDGLVLRDAFVAATVRCAPPDNRPTPGERARCRPFLERELKLLRRLEVVVCLGGLAWGDLLRLLTERGFPVPVPRPHFGHLAELDLAPSGPLVIASYHPSQQNTFTGRLTEPMLDAVFARARARLGKPPA